MPRLNITNELKSWFISNKRTEYTEINIQKAKSRVQYSIYIVIMETLNKKRNVFEHQDRDMNIINW